MNNAKVRLLVTDNTHAMLAYWDAGQVCRFANQAYVELFGKTPEEIIDKITLKELLGNLYHQTLPYIEKVLAGETQVFHRDIILSSGEVKHSLATYYPDIEHETVKGFFVHVADLGTDPLNIPHITGNIGAKIVQINDTSNESNNDRQATADKRMAEVAEFLKTQIFNGFPGLPLIAKKYLVSVSKLKRDFKMAFAQTPMVYYRNLQMEYAEQYLKEKNVSKKELASLLNFSNPSNFSTYFKRFISDVTKQREQEKILQQGYELNKIFIAQTPFAIAMFNRSMHYLANSEQWIKDYRLEGRDLIGKSQYDIFPELEDDFKEIYSECLKGKIYNCEEYRLKRADGFIQWVSCDIRPWYLSDREIGGILIYTKDITEIKEKEDAAKRIDYILNKTSEIARIGTWERNLITGKVTWNKVTSAILELNDIKQAPFNENINFYKPGKSRDKVRKVAEEAITLGKPFDVEVEIITGKNNLKWVRLIGQAEFRDGKASTLFGIFMELEKK